MQDWKHIFLADFVDVLHPQVVDRLNFCASIADNIGRLNKETTRLKQRTIEATNERDQEYLKLAINETFSLLTGLALTQNKIAGEEK